MGDLDVLERDHHEWRLDDLDEAVRRRLDEDVAAERHAVESELPDRHVDLDALVLAPVGNLLSEAVEEPVQVLPTAPFFLLLLEFVLVTVSVLPLAVARLIELDIGRFAVELDVLRLLRCRR